MQETNERELTLIEQIHDDFFSAEDRILEQAKEIISKDFSKEKKKATRAAGLGFHKSKPAADLAQLQMEKAKLTEAQAFVHHYREKYPLHRFITEDQVQALCKKWGLFLGDAKAYTGDIPEKNLVELEAFKVSADDLPVNNLDYFGMSFLVDYMDSMRARMGAFGLSGGLASIAAVRPQDFEVESWDRDMRSSSDGRIAQPEDRIVLKSKRSLRDDWGGSANEEKARDVPFKIVAPLKDFDLTGRAVSGHRVEDLPPVMVDDPIVLQPVKGGYLIVTAWGPEASDPAIVNSINN